MKFFTVPLRFTQRSDTVVFSHCGAYHLASPFLSSFLISLRLQTVAKKTTVRGLKDIMRRVMHFPPHAPLFTFDAEKPKVLTRLGS